jgi:Putative binding domain, N-terminal
MEWQLLVVSGERDRRWRLRPGLGRRQPLCRGGVTTAGGNSANRVAKWNGSFWSSMGSGMVYVEYPESTTVYTLLWDGANLYAGGHFTAAGGTSANYVARWDGSSWSPLGSGVGNWVQSLAWDGANLYAGGVFGIAGGNSANNIAKWNGSSWSPLGSGVNNYVLSLAWDGANLYAGGWFSAAGGNSASHIARWDGSSWSPLGCGVNGDVWSLAWDGANIYAGGEFTIAGGNRANYIAKWDGSSWSPLGTGMNGGVDALAWDGANLYAGGAFTSAGGKPATVAYLSPTAWTVKPTSANASYKGGQGTITFTVSADGASAEVTASSSDPWLTISSPTSVTLKNGKGSGKVTWSALPNPASTTRSASITIGTRTVTITQFAAPCVAKLTPTSISETDNTGGTATITVTAPDACGWEVSQGTAAWITPTPLSGIGSGTISLDIAANATGKSRTGKVTVATEAKSASVTVKQPK